jgi:hypothetical protein
VVFETTENILVMELASYMSMQEAGRKEEI